MTSERRSSGPPSYWFGRRLVPSAGGGGAAVLLLYAASMHATAQHLGSGAMGVEEGTAPEACSHISHSRLAKATRTRRAVLARGGVHTERRELCICYIIARAD